MHSKTAVIIGAGPAGLTAALRLAQRGYGVTVYEKLPVAGGMMAVGIPEYRLPKEPLFAEIENIERAGVEIRCNQSLGSDFTVNDLLDRDGYNAVILAIGAHKSRKLGIPGEKNVGVVHGTDFLREIGVFNRRLGSGDQRLVPSSQAVVNGKRVAVIGGGNVALDAARTAWRLGAKEVHVIYRRQREAMPAYAEEVKAAVEEGIQFHFLANPVKVLGDSYVTGLVIQRQRLGEFDAGGRRRPIPVDGDEFTLDVDMVIPAIGQTTDTAWMQDTGISATRSSTFVVNEALATTRAGVFAAGDAVSGPATVVEAVAQGMFHLWPVRSIDEGIERLTGVPAGERGPDGAYPPDTVNGRVDRRLHELAEKLEAFGKQPRETVAKDASDDDEEAQQGDKEPTGPTEPPPGEPDLPGDLPEPVASKWQMANS